VAACKRASCHARFHRHRLFICQVPRPRRVAEIPL
jgi:hypothetical protein